MKEFKFGFVLEMKVGIIYIYIYILGNLLELVIKIWQFENLFLSKSGEFGPFFFHEKSF
jgi:hypothetical protein